MEHYDFILPSGEPIAVVYTAQSWTEAVVVRGLLESSGIASPALGDGYPSDIAPLYCAIEIYALASQAYAARKVIAEHLRGDDDPEGLDDVAKEG